MPNPVLLVHGILGQRHLYWNILRRRLEERGTLVAEAVLPSYLFGDLRDAARFLARRVDEVQEETAARRVDLVAHSAGGLVSRHYLARMRGARHVERAILMGTPNAGTHLSTVAAFPFLQVAAQTRPGSPFLKELERHRVPARTQVWNLWSPIDGVVLPASNAMLQGARNVTVHTTHWGFLWSRKVHALVGDLLAGKEPLEDAPVRDEGPDDPLPQ